MIDSRRHSHINHQFMLLTWAARAVVFFVVIVGAGTLSTTLADQPLKHRWVYLMTNLQVNENLPKAESLVRRAAKAGYNGIVLADFKLNVLDRVTDNYFKNTRQFKAAADELQIEVIPAVAPFGYSEGILTHDPNLAEGLPARDGELNLWRGRLARR
jgi:hypothetical protein